MNLENLRTLWDAHSRAIYVYLLRLTKCPEEASDHLQELFCRLARQPEIIARLNGDARGFLLRAARNGVVDQVRRGQARDRIFEKINAARAGETIPASDPDQALIRGALEQALQQLPAEQRLVMIERLWKKRTFDEIAVSLGVSINTVASRYRYAIDKMREALRSLYEDLATGSSSEPSKTMKKTPRTSFTETEAPIIQPLEPRRVPSATGAVFALPILPLDDHSADHTADEPAPTVVVDDGHSDTPVDTVPVPTDTGAGDGTGLTNLGDPLPADGTTIDHPTDPTDIIAIDDPNVTVPITFDDVTSHLDDGTDPGNVGDPSLEHLIYWALPQVPLDPSTGLDDGDHGGAPIDDGTVTVDLGDGHGDVPVDSSDPSHVDDTHSADDGTTALTDKGTHDGETDPVPSDGSSFDPGVIYTMAGGVHPVDVHADAGSTDHPADGTPVAVPLDLTSGVHLGDPAPAHDTGATPVATHDGTDVHSHDPAHPAAHDIATPATDLHPSDTTANQDAAHLDLHLPDNAPLFAVSTDAASHFSAPGHVAGLSEVEHGDHAEHDAASHELNDHSAAANGFTQATPLAGSDAADSHEISWHSADSTAHENLESTDHWVPLTDHETADSAHHDNIALDAPHHANEPAAAHHEVATVTEDTHVIAPDSGAAMAATGAMIVGAEPLKRRRKQVD